MASPTSAPHLLGLDHVVLRCHDLEAMVAFYTGVLGCTFDARVEHLGLVHLRAGAALIDLVDASGVLGRRGGEPPRAGAPNLEHLCLRIGSFDIDALRAHFTPHGIDLGEVQDNYGADGEGPAVYLRDPEGNGIELKGPCGDAPRSG